MASLPASLWAQTTGSALPPTPPTGTVAPIAAIATAADRAGAGHHRAQVSYAGGQLQVRAENSSLNSILRMVAQATGMKITGGVRDQRVFGNYGPAAPATVLATLLDGTDTNLLLRETAADQPAELILTPRTGGVTPPNPNQVAEEDAEDNAAAAVPAPGVPAPGSGYTEANPNGSSYPQPPAPPSPNADAVPAEGPGVVSGPVSIPQPINNVNGSASNTSPTAASYPTTNSVPLDTLPTPSTTPATTGIVDAPNPPPAGSDTAALLNGRTTNMPGNTTIVDRPTSSTVSPGGTNTAVPAPAAAISTPATNAADATTPAAGTLTPQQVYDQLQKLRQQNQSASQTTSQSSPQSQTTPATQPQ